MEIKITLFITLLMHALIISRSFFYLVALSPVLKKLGAGQYAETRQLLLQSIQGPMQVVYLVALGANILLTAFCVINPGGWLFLGSLAALIALLADVFLAIFFSQPLSRIMNGPLIRGNSKKLRSRWYLLNPLRQALNMAGLVCLLGGMILALNG